MEHIYMDGGEVLQDEKAMPRSPINNVKLEEGDNSSELKMEPGKMSSEVPLLLVKSENNSGRCSLKSCPCGNKLNFPNYISFVSPSKNLSGHCIALAEFRTSDPQSIFSRTTSLFNIPMNLRGKFRRRTRSINNLDDLFVECPSAVEAGEVILSSSGRWFFDSMEGTIKARDLLKSSLFFNLGIVDGTMSQLRSGSGNKRQIKSPVLNTSGLSETLFQIPRTEVMSFGKQTSLLNISDRMLLSSSSTNSACSYQSTSSSNYSFSKALLYCVWKGGIPYFIFSMDGVHGEVYVANPKKIKSSVDKALDYIYLFHLRTDSKRDSKEHHNNASGVVGKMKVSSSLVLNSNRSKLMETEFVLFGAHEDHSREMQTSCPTVTKSKGFSKKMAEIFRPSQSFKHKSIHNISEPSFQFEDFMQEMFVDQLDDLNEVDHANQLHEFLPNLELAAIVVKDFQHGNKKEEAIGGWGLKFLEKVEVDNADTSEEPSFSSRSHKEGHSGNRRQSDRRMDVVVPAGFHGGPISRSGGPSSLTERWRSGGHCDCGGWDIGCPLTVLNDNSMYSKDLPHGEPEGDCKEVNLFVEGKNHGEPALRMVNTTSEGLYFIYFQSSLSALQSFSTAIAIIHTQTPDLYPTM